MKMSMELHKALARLRQSHNEVKGKEFKYFQCPILYTDEEIELCKAHIINQAFPNPNKTRRSWTVQRKDIDNFYGAMFEADFTISKYTEDGLFDEVLFNGGLTGQIKPKLTLDGEEIGFFITGDKTIPSHFSRLRFKENEQVEFALKMPTSEVEKNISSNWRIEVSKNIDLSAVVSLIKSAHLTMFKVLEYNYAYSAGGYFVGHDMLGDFFSKNRDQKKQTILSNAMKHFEPYFHIVRSVITDELTGTINDGKALYCVNNHSEIWACIVIVNTGNILNAIILPTFINERTVVDYLDFLKDKETHLRLHVANLFSRHMNPERFELTWVKDLPPMLTTEE